MHDLVERSSEETRAAHRRDLRIRIGLSSGEVAVRAIDEIGVRFEPMRAVAAAQRWEDPTGGQNVA